jgi:hypothetical protein
MQSRRHSWIETGTNTAIGFVGSWIITMVVLYTVDNKTLAGTITVILCTIWSLVRGYSVRRYFNRKAHMSSTRLCYGTMLPLITVFTKEQREEFNDKHESLGIRINYEGTIAYINENALKTYREQENLFKVIMFGSGMHMQAHSILSNALGVAGVSADYFRARWFSCVWYDGSDNPIDELTLASFSDPSSGI